MERTLEWLSDKGLDSKAVTANQEVAVSANAVVKWLVPEADKLGGKTQRVVLTESGPGGEWKSRVTVREPEDGNPWFWMDVEGPSWAGAPRLVRDLIDEYICLDRGVRLTNEPVVIQASQVDALIDTLRRPGRRTLSFIAGSSAELPLPQWKKLVSKILKQSVGQASGYVLDPLATVVFNQRVGTGFGVHPGMLRTYLPGLDIDDYQDASRHRFVTAASIAGQDFRRLGKTLSYKAREVAQESLLDRTVRRVDLQLDSFDIRIPEVESAPRTSGPTESGPRSAPKQSDQPPRPGTTPPIGDEDGTYLALRALVEEFAEGPFSPASIDLLRGQLLRAQDASNRATRLLSVIDQKSAALDEAAVEQARLRDLVDDLELDAAETWELLEEQYTRTRAAQETELALRAHLAKAGSDVDWAAVDTSQPAQPTVPENFNILVERVVEFPFITFTGDKDLTARLDEHDAVGRWCSMTWSILAALNDYAELKNDGSDIAGMHAYLESPPPGVRIYPAGRHARDESASVKQNPLFRTPRILPVPFDINPSGEIFMGAHFRIAKHGMVSPRLHYLDATGPAGRMIVGYIGPHLPNTQTN